MTTDDITQRPEQSSSMEPPLLREEMPEEQPATVQMQPAMQTAEGMACPHCGTVNAPDAMFCLACGNPLRMGVCPNCGSEIDPDADFCEVCHRYIRTDVCSFCGASLTGTEAYCPECGNPRGGIVCPTCRTLNDFAFCKQCGAPLTEEARSLVAELQKRPDYQELVQVARELEELNLQLPYNSERDVVRDQMNQKLRARVLLLLAKDEGVVNPVIPEPTSKRISKEELDAKKKARKEQLTRILDQMAIPAQASPAKVRNYAMAQKPVGVRLAWQCNYKLALHAGPCGCAKPQLGGRWIILGMNKEIKDDK